MAAALQEYTLMQWLMLFYIYCFLGWCFETTYVSICQRRFVNRGFIRLPLLPIYGSGAMCILLVCLPYQGKYATIFVLGIIFPTILEYVTGWVMERLFKMRYWDYSSHKVQLNGYICLSSSIAWGVLSVLLIQVINPPVAQLVKAVPRIAGCIIVAIVSVAFVSDFAAAFRTAFGLRHLLEELERLRTQLDEARVQLELAKAEARDQIEQRRLELNLKKLRNEMQSREFAMNSRYLIRALLRAHPSARSVSFDEPLRRARERAIKFRRAVDEKMEEFREDIQEIKEQRDS